ncbi:CMP-N-acetylneuraminate-beta-galactosamide-alpha-2,3-sialyltransferase 2 isoform X2 [Tupaia chinensis]|uniref:CMP-N-acetylneuraminate-beta-galactosamide- alpha-2,3-sialyltransferase 2 isoform X2 n=1 Tax=Tupaia chinensis TaxID=246437 RepID=UPI0003C91596|nr:CMP-N-acetylneuraminate-beta-galactosamide-alpha-2,3-sialyltransferase 2 isoform X2 [Tupaia chinensis]
MRIRFWNLGLGAACILSLWLIVSILSQKSSQNSSLNNLYKMTRMHLKPCHCPRNFSNKCGCSHMAHKCSVCVHMPGDSDWFDEHYERAIEPLQKTDEPMSYDALVLWLGLETIKSEEIKNKQKQLAETPPRHSRAHVVPKCQTCAVVGNSMSLRGSGFGFQINQHDVILRMNQAPVQGFERDVGSMTTMRIMYLQTVSTQDLHTQLLLLPLNSSGVQWFLDAVHNQKIIWKPRNPGYQMVQVPDAIKDKVQVISLSFLKYIQENWLEDHSHYPSLGFVALLYALHTCDQVSLFGFGADSLKRWSHYWDGKYLFKNTMEKFPAEHQIILKLQCEGKITVYS